MTKKIPIRADFINMVGFKTEFLKVISYAGMYRNKPIWNCVCSCGKAHIVQGSHLRSGHTKSCGCEKSRGRPIKHGASKTPTHRTWLGMIARCRNPKSPIYYRYGGRGIKICERWLSFENFLLDMGERPIDREIDRINNDGHYEPGNCRWATASENMRNTSSTVFLTHNGETRCITEWAETVGMKMHTLWARLARGWSAEKALTKPPSGRK